MAERLRDLPVARGLIARARRLLDRVLRGQLAGLVDRTDGRGHPNVNALWERTRDVEILRADLEAMAGWMAAREAERAGLGRKLPPAPPHVGLACKATTQADVESEWVAYWCHRLGVRPSYHRKVWERCYVLQALHERLPDLLAGGRRGIGFGCGREPLGSLLASLGHDVVLTDLPPEAGGDPRWAEAGMQLGAGADAFHPALVDRATFDARVTLRWMDMNALDRDLDGAFDFCWSVCALEHLGSIARGLDFVEASLRVLRPGGVAVHTTEWSYESEDETIDDWPTVLFQRRHFEALARRLAAAGFEVAPLDFGLGDGPLDRFVGFDPGARPERTEVHLKLAIDGFPCTCFGLIVRRPDAAGA